MQEVECRAFCGQQGAGFGLNLAEHLPRLDTIAIADVPADFGVCIELLKAAVEPGLSGQHGVLAADHRAQRPVATGNQHCRQVTAADVFEQRCHDIAVDLGRQS